MRFRTVLVAAAIMLGACGGGSTPGSVLVVDPPNVTESYLLLQIHREYARNIGNVWSQAWNWCGGVSNVDSSGWEDSKTVTVSFGTSGPEHDISFQFSKLGYDPSTSTISYGTAKEATKEVGVSGQKYIYDLTGATQDGHFMQSVEVSLERSRSVEITHGVTFDATVESETKVSGSYLGVGLEQTIKASFGYSNSQEEKRAQEESTAQTETHGFDEPLPANAVTSITLMAGSTTAATPVTIDGVAVWTETVTLGKPCVSNDSGFWKWWDNAGRYVVSPNNPAVFSCWQLPAGVSDSPTSGPANTFGGAPAASLYDWIVNIGNNPCSFTIPFIEVNSMFSGRNAAWQGFAGWLDAQPAATAAKLADGLDAGRRSVSVSGIQNTEAEHDLVTKVRTISPADIPDLLAEGYVQCSPGSTTC